MTTIKISIGSLTSVEGITREVVAVVFVEANTVQFFDKSSVYDAWLTSCVERSITDPQGRAETLVDTLMFILEKAGEGTINPYELPLLKPQLLENFRELLKADVILFTDVSHTLH